MSRRKQANPSRAKCRAEEVLAEESEIAEGIGDAQNTAVVLPEDPPEEMSACSIQDYADGNLSDQEVGLAEYPRPNSHESAEDVSSGQAAEEQLADSSIDSSQRDDELMRADYVSSPSTPTEKSGGAKSAGSAKRGQKIQPRQTEYGDRAFECPKCKMCFGNEQELNNHISDHNKESDNPNTCVLCGQRLSSASSLERHMLVHSGHRPFSCSKCGMTFTTNGNMHRHMRTHAKNEQLEATAQLARSRGGRGRGGAGKDGPGGGKIRSAKHLAVPSMWPYPTFVMPGYLARSGNLSAEKPAQNGLGTSIAATEDMSPIKRVAGISLPVKIHPAFGTNLNLLAQHIAPLPQVTTPKIPKEETTPKSERQCPLCKQRFLIISSLKHHLAMHHSNAHVCLECHESFTSSQSLNDHMVTFHENQDSSGSESSPGMESERARTGFHDLILMPFTSERFPMYAKARCEKIPRKGSSFLHNHACEYCGKAFPMMTALRLHRQEHCASGVTTCHKCNITFSTREELTAHMKIHSADDAIEKALLVSKTEDEVVEHVTQENFLATMGLVQKTEMSKLMEDMKENKEEVNRATKVTNKTYFPAISQMPKLTKSGPEVESAEKIIERLQKSNGWTGGSLVTSGSSVSVSTDPSSSLSPIPHPPGDVSAERSFDCKYCEEVFPTKKELNAHVRNHKGVAPYQCHQCSYKSTDKSTLKRHNLTHTGERPHLCTLCKQAFTTKANCERHIRKKHNHADKEEARRFVLSLPRLSSLPADTSGATSQSESQGETATDSPVAEAMPCKVYRCKLCKIGFFSWYLAQSHLQVRHLVVGKAIAAMLEECAGTSGIVMADDDESLASGCSTPDISCLTPQSHSSTPPRAHSTPPSAMPTPPPRAHSNPPSTHAVGVPFPPSLLRQVKLEPEDEDSSCSSSFSSPENRKSDFLVQVRRKITSTVPKEEPMDLSVKSSSSASTPERQTPSSSSSSKEKSHKCDICSESFPSAPELLSHLESHCSQASKTRASDQNNNPVPKTGAVLQSLARLAPMTVLALQAPLASSMAPGPSAVSSPDRSANYGSDSSSDLASINRILDATNPHNFRRFLPTEADEEKGESPRGKRPREDEIDEDEEDEDSMDPSHLDYEMDGDDEDDFDKEDEEARLIAACGPGEGGRSSRKDHSQSLHPWVPPMSASSSPDTSSLGSGDASKDCQEPKPKKKRNSYAETPHNLFCRFPGCSRSFPWKSSLMRHMSTHTGEKPYRCAYCDMQFSTKSNRERHLVRKHGVNMLDPASRQTMDRPYKCHVCTFSSFATESNLRKHYQERHNGASPPALSQSRDMELPDGSFVFPLGSVRNGDEESFQMSEREDMEQSRSSSASRNGSALNEADSHVGNDVHQENHNEEDEDEDEDEEDEEEETTESNAVLPAESPINPERDNYNVDKITSCWKCKNSFDSRKLLLRHLKEHNIDLPFKCYLCDASYDNRKVCMRHMQQEHSKPWLQVSKKNGVTSIQHFSAKMDEIVERNCRLSQVMSAGGDVGALQNEESKNGDDSASSEGVTADYVQRKVYCSFCPKRFWSLQDLRRHMRSHTGERPYECSTCLKRFTLKHSMTRHQTKNRRCGCASPALSEGSAGDEAGVRSLPDAAAADSSTTHAAAGSLLLASLAAAGISLRPGLPKPQATPVLGLLKKSLLAKNPEPEEEDESSPANLLHNLLGVENEDIDQLLRATPDAAARMLGVEEDGTTPSESDGAKVDDEVPAVTAESKE